jgi:hypothetical protein
MQTKTASDEHVNSLAAAIARAQKEHQAKKTPEQETKKAPEQEKAKPDTVASPDVSEEAPREEKSESKPKKIREVPEDILRKVLSE